MDKKQRAAFAVAQYKQGVTVARISEVLGVSRVSVRNYLKEAGFTLTNPAVDPAKLRVLHKQGLHDAELARRLNCSCHKVKRMREELGLAAHEFDRSTVSNAPVIVDDVKALELYERGLSDWEAGLELGVSANAFRRWRIGRELEPNQRTEITDALERQIESLYKSGQRDRQIAAELRISEESVRAWRIRNNIEARFPALDEAKAMELYEAGMTDREIAEKVGCVTATILQWRRRKGLPTKFSYEDWFRINRRKISTEQVKELYDQGMNDSEIAENLGCSTTLVRLRRRELGIDKPIKKRRANVKKR